MIILKEYSIIFKNGAKIEYGDVEIGCGEFVGISGNSGCGKSAMLDSLFGMNFEGEVICSKSEFMGKDMKLWGIEKYSVMGYIPQFSPNALNPKLTVGEHITLIAKSNKLENIDSKVSDIFKRLRLDEGCVKSYPHMLSGGQKQRIILALMTLRDLDLLVLDEPSSAIDPITLKYIAAYLEIIKENMTIIMVSHNHEILNSICDRVITF